MLTRARSIAITATLLMLAAARAVAADIEIPTQGHDTLSFELQSLRDDITLYRGDPQQLLLMRTKPDRFKPRVEFDAQTHAVLRVRDLYWVEHPEAGSQTAAERDQEQERPLAEQWEMRLCPSGPTTFSLRCERGESEFDFTDFEVQSVDIRAEETVLSVDFSNQNPIELEAFGARVLAGSLQFRHMLNARAKTITLYVPGAACKLEVTGREFDGESAINVQGVPAGLQLVVSRKLGLRVTGPAATTARFAAPHMTQNGADWVSQGHEAAKCRVRLTFAEEIPKLQVTWK